MSSLAFPQLGVCSCRHNRRTKPSAKGVLGRSGHQAPKAIRAIITSVQNQTPRILAYEPSTNSVLFGRREAAGLGLVFSLMDFLSRDGISNAAEAAPTGCELTVAPSGIAFCDKVVGYGPEAVKGQLIKAHYVGKLENGTVFDSSYNRGKPLTFRVGVGEVIKGWDQGILGADGIPAMLAGGKRSLKLPPELAYGGRGAGCRGGSCIVPPNSVLLFDVEFIGKA